MPKISQIDEVPCQAEVRILQKITLKAAAPFNELDVFEARVLRFFMIYRRL